MLLIANGKKKNKHKKLVYDNSKKLAIQYYIKIVMQ